MKYPAPIVNRPWDIVASLAEAWIEILKMIEVDIIKGVASLAEAWIEIVFTSRYTNI